MRPSRPLDWVGAGALAFGLVNVASGLMMAFAPGAFFEQVGPYGVRNDHYLGDLATFSIALGAALCVSARLPAWRVPVLTVAFVQGLMHAVNHLIDVGEARPAWLGPANLAALAATAALLALLLAAARRAK